ncbi:MAG: hypothetical protein Q9218_000762 [Villophora microphyllina]
MFSERDITYPSDRLPAVSAIARVIQEQNNFSYICGLWKEQLLFGLTWSAAGPQRQCRPTASDESKPPSWTWVSRERQICYPIYEILESDDHGLRDNSINEARGDIVEIIKYRIKAQINEVSCNSIDVDSFGRVNGGRLTLTAFCRPARCLLEMRKVQGKRSEILNETVANSCKIYWDCVDTDVPRDDAAFIGLMLVMIWRVVAEDQSGCEDSDQEKLYLVVALLTKATAQGSSDCCRVGLVELYETGRRPNQDLWRETTVHII